MCGLYLFAPLEGVAQKFTVFRKSLSCTIFMGAPFAWCGVSKYSSYGIFENALDKMVCKWYNHKARVVEEEKIVLN